MTEGATVAVISDIHGNSPALNAVLDDIPPEVDGILCLGDIVGYNAGSKVCLEKVRDVCEHIVRGNHDRDINNPESYRASTWSPSSGNRAVRKGLELAKDQLSQDDIEWITNLPDTKLVHSERIFMCHSHPEHTDTYTQKGDFPSVATYMDSSTEVLLLGHTHQQASVDMSKFDRHGWVVNPGSVGQPRDGTAAKYALLKFHNAHTEVELRSVSYPINEIIKKNDNADLPSNTSQRLKEN